MLGFFSNEKEILQNLHLTKNEVALKVHASMQIFLVKSSSHSASSFCLHVQIQYHNTNSKNFKNFRSSL